MEQEFLDQGTNEIEESLDEEILELSELGHLEAVINAFGHTFKLKTLTTFEKVYIAKEMGNYSQTYAVNFFYPREVVAFSLLEVDGKKFIGLSAEETKNCLERATSARNEINKWSWEVVAFLFNVYAELAKKEEEIVGELKKKAKILSPSWLSLNTETGKAFIQEDTGQPS